MQAPYNNVIVTISTKYIKNFTNLLKQSQLAHNTEFNAADLVQIVGTVISVPKKILSTPDYAGFTQENIKPGDTVIFRYDVVFAFNKPIEGKPPTFKNCFWWKGQEYWAVDIQKVFAVIREGKIVMQNGYCMVENIEQPSKLIIPGEMKRLLSVGKATVTQVDYPRSGAPSLELKRLDTAYLNPSKIQHYQINNHKFGIVEQRQIFGSDPILYE
jgi:hypothetical protein